MSISYENIPTGLNHWVGLFKSGDPNETYIRYVFIESGSGATLIEGPSLPGDYELRLFYNDSYNLEESISFSIAEQTSVSLIELTSEDSIKAGSVLSFNYNNIPSGNNHWVGLYMSGATNETYIRYVFIEPGSGTAQLAGPSIAGNYELRLFYNDSYELEESLSFSVSR